MSATIRALFEDVKSADSEAATVSSALTAKQREVAELESQLRLAAVKQRDTRSRLVGAIKPDKPYRLDDQHIVRKTAGRLVVEELADPEKEQAVPPVVPQETWRDHAWKYGYGAWIGIKHTAVVTAVLGALVFGAITLVGYLNGRPDAPDPVPPAPAPDDPSLSDLAKQFKKAITSNLDRDKTTAAEAEKLAANFDTVSSEISQCVAGAGHAELKEPGKIDARLKEINSTTVDGNRWRSVFVAFASIADAQDDAGKLSAPSDYIQVFNAAAQALRSFAKGR